MDAIAKKNQWLTQVLILSALLNVALLTVCVYYALRQKTIDVTGSLPVEQVEVVAEELVLED